jgi:hypothetical protein
MNLYQHPMLREAIISIRTNRSFYRRFSAMRASFQAKSLAVSSTCIGEVEPGAGPGLKGVYLSGGKDSVTSPEHLLDESGTFVPKSRLGLLTMTSWRAYCD